MREPSVTRTASDRVEITVRSRPVPLQRSRTRSGRHYLPQRSKTYRQLVQAEWMAAGRPTLGDATFTMSARFYGANPRADLDNLCKAILDALNKLAYVDDTQLVCLSGCHKLPADEHGPRVEIQLWAAERAAA